MLHHAVCDKNNPKIQAWWNIHLIPATQEALGGGSWFEASPSKNYQDPISANKMGIPSATQGHR
jgi:hypothetical protein